MSVGEPDLAIRTAASLPVNEEQRLQVLRRYQILDTEQEQAYDDLVLLAATICGTPTAMMTLVDRHRQWFKARLGMDSQEQPRELSFCAHAILQPGELMTVSDARADPRFAENPLVTGEPGICFYAGVPLVTREGAAIGTICVIDQEPRELNPEQGKALHCLARQVVMQLELREAVAELEQQSLTDPLTGVWNRRAFDHRLREEWARHARGDSSLALLMIDIDRFKKLNDTLGHLEGDRTLQKVAQLLAPKLRLSDHLVRYGGEEFCILLPGCGAEGARIAAERARLAISTARWDDFPVTVSIGVALGRPSSGEDPNLLIARADFALYRAKEEGRDRVEVFTDWRATGPR